MRFMRLRDRYPQLTPEQRQALAAAAGIKPPYLWQLATGWKGKRAARRPSLQVMLRLVDADPKLTLKDLAAEFSDERVAA